MKAIGKALLTFLILGIASALWPEVVITDLRTSVLVALLCTICGWVVVAGLSVLVVALVATTRSIASIVVATAMLFFAGVIVNGVSLFLCDLIFRDFQINNIAALLLMAVCMNFISGSTIKVNNNTSSTSTSTTGYRSKYRL